MVHMLRINQVKITPKDFVERKEACLSKKIAKILHITEEQIQNIQIVKQSIDARKKPDIFYSLVIDVTLTDEEAVLKKCRDKNVMPAPEVSYQFPCTGSQKLKERPIIIGSGPAGIFCAYQLALHGFKPIVLERGEDAESRLKSVTHFWEKGELNTNSNVQFGEGGAGTFSDGKLNTLVKDKYGRNKEVLQIFVKAGAPEKILYENKPHLGTDILITIVKNMREEINRHGGEVRFQSEVTDFIIEDHTIQGVIINEREQLKSNTVVLAIGHSARNTLETLYKRQVPMEAKAFAVGLRVEHSQKVINHSQYGVAEPEYLDAAPYKVNAQTATGRGVYSFCMCPGGYVVNSSSEQNRLAINGMSYSKRDGKNANSAIIVSVTPEDFAGEDALAGIAFQRKLEEKAYQIGNGKIPVQYWCDYKANIASKEDTGKNQPAMKGAYVFTNVREILPEEINASIMEGMQKFGKMIKGFDAEDALLSGIESRTSSPVRIHRDENLQSAIVGLYPCGEGAGYAGGITSAAMDGIKVAEEIAKRFAPY